MKKIKDILKRIVYAIGLIATILLIGIILFFIYIKKINPEYNEMSYNDGPYIFYLNDTIIKSVIAEETQNREFTTNEEKFNLKDASGIYSSTRYLPDGFIPSEEFHFSTESQYVAEKIAALSDIHGSYNHLKALLKSNGIINDSLNWNWGEGHLVILGDVFDKGPYVTECLWLIKKLEAQANKNGGKVHFLLGNHEMYILQNNTDFCGAKYTAISARLLINYDQLYGPDTYLGRWLRTRNGIIMINRNLFVHGGISQSIIDNQYSLNDINKYLNILANPEHLIEYELNIRDKARLLDAYYGPLEYRGYFNKNFINRGQSSGFPVQTIDSILEHFNTDHIIVGHTIVKEIKGMFENKIIAIDNEFPKDDILEKNSDCQMMIIEGTNYYLAGINGVKTLLFSDSAVQ